jgi:hypothetical protein
VADPVALCSWVLAVMVVSWAVLLPLGLPYDRLLKRQLRSTAHGTRRRDPPGVFWQLGRWDSDPSHMYVANIGDGTAYQVSVAARDEVIERTSKVPPCRADRMNLTSTLPYYVTFGVGQPPKRQIRVSWRSENDEWFSQVLPAS